MIMQNTYRAGFHYSDSFLGLDCIYLNSALLRGRKEVEVIFQVISCQTLSNVNNVYMKLAGYDERSLRKLCCAEGS